MKINSSYLQRMLLFLGAFIFFHANNGQSQQTQALYVSPSGDDTNLGTLEKPMATLQGVKEKVRTLKADGKLPQGGITVYFREGTYAIRETVAFGPEDGGTPQAPIIYRNYEDEEVYFSGGKEIPQQALQKVSDSDILKRLPQTARDKVWAVDLKTLGITDYGKLHQHGFSLSRRPAPMELFVQGKPQTLARWPDEGTVKIGEVIDPGSMPRKNDFSNRGGIFKYNYEREKRWEQADDIWLNGIFSWGYADDNLKVEYIDTDKHEIKVVQPHVYSIRSSSDKSRGHELRGYYVYNLLEEINIPGEYYIDRIDGVLYCYPPSGPGKQEFVVSMMEEPFLALENVSFIQFTGFYFEHGRGMGIYMEKGEGNVIADCIFRNLGTVGIMMGKGVENTNGSVHSFTGKKMSRQIGNFGAQTYENNAWNREAGKNHLIKNCEFYYLGTGGIILDGGDRKTLTPGNNVVDNCEFYDVNRWNKTYCPPVMLRGVGNRVTHNYIHDAPHLAISLHGNNHLIEYNHIAKVCQNVSDMGAIYMGRNPSERGTIIRYNYFHDIESESSWVAAIYLDDGSGGGQVFGNVFYKTGNPKFGAIFVSGGHDHIFENNIFIDCKRVFGNGPWNNERWNNMLKSKLWKKRLRIEVDITQPPYTTQYPELKNFYKQDERTCKAINNLVYQCDIVKVRQFEMINNFITDQNPGFVDIQHQNFRLKKDAVVFKKMPDFQPIPFNQIGLRKEEVDN